MKIRWRRVFITVVITCFLLPFLTLVTPPGTAIDQARLTQIINRLKQLEKVCDNQKLQRLLRYTSSRYNTIGRCNVRVNTCFNAGFNIFWCPGVTINKELWRDSKLSNDALLVILVHEAAHDYYPYFGHYHMHGIVPAQGYNGFTSLERLIGEN